MANEKFTDLPSASASNLSDIICAVQGYIDSTNLGTSTQMTLQQVATLLLANTVLHYAGNPNGNVAGTQYQLCWDSTGSLLYVCTSSGTVTTAVWTLAASTALPVPASDGGTGVASPTAHTLPVAEGSSAFTFLGPLTNGQLLVGSTGADPVAATLTAGTGVNIANSAGTITISVDGSGYTWTEVTGTSQAMAINSGYIANNASLVTLTLPSTATPGSTVAIQGKGAGLFKIAQNSGQTIHFGTSDTTTGTGGSLTAVSQYNSIQLICITADTDFAVLTGAQGNFTVA